MDKSERGLHLIELISDRQKLDSSGNSEEMSDSVSLLQLDLSKGIYLIIMLMLMIMIMIMVSVLHKIKIHILCYSVQRYL